MMPVIYCLYQALAFPSRAVVRSLSPHEGQLEELCTNVIDIWWQISLQRPLVWLRLCAPGAGTAPCVLVVSGGFLLPESEEPVHSCNGRPGGAWPQ